MGTGQAYNDNGRDGALEGQSRAERRGRRRGRGRVGVGALLSVGVVGAGSGVASASPTQLPPVRVPQPAPMEPDASVIAAEETGIEAQQNAQVDLPRRGSGAIALQSLVGNPDLSVGLPGGLHEQARTGGTTSTAFPSVDQTFSVTAESLATGARALIAIRSSAAPTEYRFEIEAEGGSTLVLDPSGAVEIRDGMGEPVGRVDAPWAIDASGAAVPTSFRIDGDTLVQTIAHAGAVYPVIADPAVQHDCGILTCTLRFDRSRTKWIADYAGNLAGLGAGACQATGPWWGACTAAVVALGWSVQTSARNYYNNGNCYGIRHSITGGLIPPPHSHQVTYGTYNCAK